MKPLLIVNPRSGGGSTGRVFDSMRGTIERALGPFDVAMTERQGHGIELAREGALAGHPLVIAVGGDGTLHEVANGLMFARETSEMARDTRLAMIAQGTGGDFRKSLGLEHRLDKYLEAIASGRERTIDVGRFQGGGKAHHYFVNILSVGMGGLVDRYVAQGGSAFGGKAAYFGASARALINARLGNVVAKVTRDGKTEERRIRSFMIAVCNGRYFGGGMQVAPTAELDDGLFEVVALGATSKLGFVLNTNRIYSGAHMRQSDTVHLRGEKIVFELANQDAREMFLLDVDGEAMGQLPITIEMLPKALTLRA
ncbi:Transcription regulator [Labilithrix luteola]|uniref:Transcription regulator n=1 Tax=Labilithrix luteola TaxID=1391654 RepID=A0A0K1PMH3_9BACT|nr:diacylglycerol kinase family protein [Labilithrix luteola]AKU94314.1 Transcription regulator [Labilithrix luteola]